jgi:hypothetical protein
MLAIEQAFKWCPPVHRLRFIMDRFFWIAINNNSNCMRVGMQGCVPNKTTTSVLVPVPQRHSLESFRKVPCSWRLFLWVMKVYWNSLGTVPTLERCVWPHGDTSQSSHPNLLSLICLKLHLWPHFPGIFLSCYWMYPEQGCQTHMAPGATFSLQQGPEGHTENVLYFLAVKMC